ncbi:5'-nucleotidase, lipoprotein e(P4) family [Bacillus sp. JJ1764]|uniref:5'-nucleotidase, lipoprotein e(P4) family n=1 Tax=Bacillus sp. JJ1764 TaxID=3122964 RepID=UPI002FFFEBF2
MKKWIALLAFGVLLFSYSPLQGQAQTIYDQNTMSVLWFQRSGEAKALYYQGYNLGKMRLDEILAKKQWDQRLKPAIVLDIDETILDNSSYQAQFIVSGQGNPLDWTDWFNRAKSKPLPGALDFLHYADSKGIAIYYISNRFESQKDATIKNLQAIGAPQAISDHILLMRKNEPSKENRRRQVSQNHDIVLLFGDNLGDFSGFDHLDANGRVRAVDQHREEFGRKLIVFPNPMYGDWETAIYRNKINSSLEELSKLRKNNLIIYQPD